MDSVIKDKIQVTENERSSSFAFSMRAKIKRRRPLNILLVEDDASDVMLTQCALDDTYIPYQLQAVRDGDTALRYLRREDEFAGEPLPDVILLDLSLPHKDGFEVMEELAKQAGFGHIPVIILSGASPSGQLRPTSRLWLCDYVAKPCNPDKLLEAFAKLHSPA